ncbi:hypothetical protein EI42_01101 [Thermosporothrix hazakensis]|jgi:hypothetical protein|uniref:Uncharacterized protein n=1 Tax=Thermosporothrix hazakensis TaxID=644383 RepID=A0A326UEP5_THEHA|nr:hypothetical protein [Thermosporothrix hazakensis]PZW34264.1 hypothetical protein EI42_01101 [Thermosporothrix hazakensis]GCE46184.1 hypothetical protein KTH_10530 [Thermosporothrix hazakensis]
MDMLQLITVLPPFWQIFWVSCFLLIMLLALLLKTLPDLRRTFFLQQQKKRKPKSVPLKGLPGKWHDILPFRQKKGRKTAFGVNVHFLFFSGRQKKSSQLKKR